MPTRTLFTTIRTEGALLPPDLLQRISEGATIDGLTPDSYHRPGEKLNEAINQSWNALQGAWASFRAAQERLPAGDLGTTVTRERWLLPLFRELDYGRLQTATAVEIDGRSYPISHGWEQVPIHLVSYQLDLDKRTPGVAGAASASPHSLLQVFLNRSDANLWGFVSNGYKLRILRDNASLTRQAYVEFDLEAMMEGEVYSDFVLLWLLCHQSRVEGERPSECWLERWMKTAEEQGTRALDQLRDGVQKAIEALGRGFLERPDNAGLRDRLTAGTLDKQDYYRQLLRLVYRLLFLFVAEDRDLLHDPKSSEASREIYRKYYSTQRLRQMAETFKGTAHPDLFEGLRLVMRVLNSAGTTANAPNRALGAQRLGLTQLGSYLFSDEAVADVIDCRISNRDLLDAVRALALVYDDKVKRYRSIDYKNLGSEELGSVYESLLEFHPQINVPARSFALATAGGNERKTTGSYYTPSSLIYALLDSALDPVLDEAEYGEGARTPRRPDAECAEQRILALKVCDPACGSGHFLIAAANRMAKALASVRTGEEEPPPSAIQQAKRDVIGHCIYGVDINPMAVELCKVNLWMEALEPGKPLSFLDHRIQCGNSLLGTTPRLMAEGIPSDAFKPIEGDDKAVVSRLRKQNAQERKDYETGQRRLFDVIEPPADYRRLAADLRDLDALDDATLAGIRAKEERYQALANDAEYQKARGLADAWCAAFVWEKETSPPTPLHFVNGEGKSSTPSQGDIPVPPPLTDRAYRLMSEKPLDPRFADVRAYVAALRERYSFFHWHVAFPDVFRVPDDLQAANEQTGWDGGFSCVLGNPPWDRPKPEPAKFFASLRPDISDAPTSAARAQLLSNLEQEDNAQFNYWKIHERTVMGGVAYLTASGMYPLTAIGKFNLGNNFLELSRHILALGGRSGMINVSGIATDDSGREFISEIMETGALVSFYDFENRRKLFPNVHSSYKFSAITLRGGNSSDSGDFVFRVLVELVPAGVDDHHVARTHDLAGRPFPGRHR